MTFMRVLFAGLLLSVPALAAEQVQYMQPKPDMNRYMEPMTLFKNGLGNFHRPMSSKNKEAQAFFDQGFQMMYAFAKPEAVRSFREAAKLDANCAICYWGEAWAWGSYLNAPMIAEEAPYAYEAIQKAVKLKRHATPKERDMIDAMAVRYVKNFVFDKRGEQDKAYADAMAKLVQKYPDDLEIATLYGDALFLMEPRRGTRDVEDPDVVRLHNVLKSVLDRDIKHPGACHLYVHATESTVDPGRAEACAEFLGNAIPGASHINHMPSHTWNEVGRWGDSVRANIQAWHSDQKAAIGEGFAIYPDHNLHMLLYSAAYDGQGAIGIQAAKDYAKRTKDTFYHALLLIRFGRFDEVKAVQPRPERDISAALWDFAQGYAALRNGEPDFAKVYLERLRKTAETSKTGFRVHSAANLLGGVVGILEGEILRAEGNLDGAIAAFERGAAIEDKMGYDEPEPLPFAVRHWLGAALLEAKRFEDAERIYREELDDHPRNGWSLKGLQLALQGQGKPTDDVDAQFASSWERSDAWIRTSRY